VNAFSGLTVRILGPGSATRNDLPVTLPRSRKVRALLAFLTLAKAPVSRSRLCDLLWDVPNDPRGELRWCLSKLRSALDDSDRQRVVVSGDSVALDLSDCRADALEVERFASAGFGSVSDEQLSELSELFAGDLLEGMQLDGNPEFLAWLSVQRQRFRTTRVALLSELSARAPRHSEEVFGHLQLWLQLAPFDQNAHAVMLDALLQRGSVREADEHVAATIRSFEREGLDWSAVREAWRVVRSKPVESAPLWAVIAPQALKLVQPPAPRERPVRRRASIAVMPFRDETAKEQAGRTIADGMTEDVIARLARLRVLFVIARGTVYALGERGIDAQEAGRILNVDYVASGALRSRDGRLNVTIELAETQGARIVWTDQIEGIMGDAFSMLDAIVNRIVAALAEEIEAAECNRALLKPPNSLDAWEAYHRGLWHMYKFNGSDNLDAARFFRAALELDPLFSRAHSGLSFTHFQNAFLALTPDHEHQIELALDTASQSLAADDRDPAGHWAMGRALWLNGKDGDSCIELERSIELSPNFALGYYTLGFVHAQSGDPQAAIVATDYSRQLSPFDPLQFGMLAARALSHVRLGQFAEAADWAVRATARPNAHTHILAIAAQCLALANRADEARRFVARIHQRSPGYAVADFLRAFRFDRETARMFRRGARKIGFDAKSGTKARL
jgi:DNA-binding SARP family transcriptional activator